MRRTRARLVAVLAAVLSVVLVATGSLLATPSSAAAVRYEAESATISQGVVESNHAGFSGTGFVNYDRVVGGYGDVDVPVCQRHDHQPADGHPGQRHGDPRRSGLPRQWFLDLVADGDHHGAGQCR